ncbi:hypothetical protein ACQPX6_11855 [Actinomycetospora sp. CA-101289]|uniref:hypothetical protein n=1 Tax=Actinomycetospora sp. CA-101289 TaxID=3239893 RepID=UPI003D99DFC3
MAGELYGRRGVVLLLSGLALAAVVLVIVSLTAAGRPAPAGPLRFGVLGSSCDAARVPALAEAGVTLAQVSVEWARFAPAPGVVDAAYRDATTAGIERCRAAGIGVVLSVGLQDAPPWVTAAPGAAYRDQYGRPGPDRVPNLAFSAAARAATAEYLSAVARTWPLDGFAAVRVGTGDNGELGYPTVEPTAGADNPYWAFDDAAQSGVGLAEGAAVSPLPGWTPGSPTYDDRPLGADGVRRWFDWYSGAIAGAARWQVDTLRALGFRGEVHLPLAGRGVLPADLALAVENHLDGTGDRDGSLAAGLDYPTQLPALAEAPGPLLVDVTGLDDATAVDARRLDPPQDLCAPDDADQVPEPAPEVDVASWSASRWTLAVASHAGLGALGENPGSAGAPNTGGDPESDDLSAQMEQATRYARACGLSALLFAFEDDLFGDPRDVSVAEYAEHIRTGEAR